MIGTADRSKERCHGCSNNVLSHHRFVLCTHCQKICHYKCALKLYNFDQLSDSWSCWECASMAEIKYNPFKSMRYDKYSQSDSENLAEISEIDQILENCKKYSYTQIDGMSYDSESSPSIFFNNIDGVASNFDMLHSDLSTIGKQFSVIALAETNIDSSNKDLYCLNGYQSIYQSKLASKRKGSCLAMYIKDDYIFTENEEFSQCTKNLECLFITLSNTSKPMTIGVVYRPPSGSMNEFINELNAIFQKVPTSNVFITGDYNIDLHKGNIGSFEDAIYGNGFSPMISIATHYKPDCNPSCIDNILTNSPDLVHLSGVCENTVTHHLPVFCFSNVTINDVDDKSPKLPRYDYCESNMITFIDSLKSTLSSNGFFDEFSLSEESFNKLVKTLTDSIESSFLIDPEQLTSRRNRIVNPWITTGIIVSIAKKYHLYKNWRKTVTKKNKHGDLSIYSQFKEFRRKLKGIIAHAKRLYNYKKFENAKGNSKEIWKIINEIRGKDISKIKWNLWGRNCKTGI